jgi:hypothetical protein
LAVGNRDAIDGWGIPGRERMQSEATTVAVLMRESGCDLRMDRIQGTRLDPNAGRGLTSGVRQEEMGEGRGQIIKDLPKKTSALALMRKGGLSEPSRLRIQRYPQLASPFSVSE